MKGESDARPPTGSSSTCITREKRQIGRTGGLGGRNRQKHASRGQGREGRLHVPGSPSRRQELQRLQVLLTGQADPRYRKLFSRRGGDQPRWLVRSFFPEGRSKDVGGNDG